MPLPFPRPGLVISYSYLWREEAERNLEEGAKDRPCAIVLSIEDRDGQTVTTVVPITHSPPDTDLCVEIPQETKRRLGLDRDRSWIVANQVNRFDWPGSDLRPVSRDEPEKFEYGVLPPALYKKVVALLIEAVRRRQLTITPRT